MGALLYPLAQGPFECLYVNASNVTETLEGYRLEYDLPESSLELSSAVITLCACNETVTVYHLHNGTRERLPIKELYATSISSSGETRTGYCYQFDATDAVIDSCGGHRLAFIAETDKRAPLYRHRAYTRTVEAPYPDLTLSYMRPSTQMCIALTISGFVFFIASAILTVFYAVVTREPAKVRRYQR